MSPVGNKYCEFVSVGNGFLHCPNCNQMDFPPAQYNGKPKLKISPDPERWPKRICRNKEDASKHNIFANKPSNRLSKNSIDQSSDEIKEAALELGIADKFSNYAKAVFGWLRQGRPRRTDGEVAAIVAICRKCEHFNLENKSCRICGCRVNSQHLAIINKARMKTETCPKGKWHKIDAHLSPEWSYGVITVPSRKNDLLPQTIDSLATAGFKHPRLFVESDVPVDYSEYNLPNTIHCPSLHNPKSNMGNWILALWELYLRKPNAIFEDDIIASKNMRSYLEVCSYPDNGYWNLYTAPNNQTAECQNSSWSRSSQKGKGALALVFNRLAVTMLLQQPYFISQPQTVSGRGNLDGVIVTAFNNLGWSEYIHNPSLVQHVSAKSTMGHSRYPSAPSFRGPDFDALSLTEVSLVASDQSLEFQSLSRSKLTID
jgi:hypothetical protein